MAFFATQAGYLHAPERKVAWQRSDLEAIAARHGPTVAEGLHGKTANDAHRSWECHGRLAGRAQ